jgi:histidinol dehydrogenase
LGAAERREALARPAQRSDPALREAVRAIVEEIRDGGWDALAGVAERLDGEAPK